MSSTLVSDKTELPVMRSEIGLVRPDRNVGWKDWMTTVDHKKIGIMYGTAACFFFLVGGVEALLIRTQLMRPYPWHIITAQMYNELFTMHGTTMIFLGVMPLSAAFFNFVVPLQIGARDVAFPRLNAFSFWTFVAGACLLNGSWVLQVLNLFGILVPADGRTDIAPGNGWFGYAPLTEHPYTGIGTDVWLLSLQILGIASLAAAFNFIATIINLRAPGMTMMRLPVFTWMTLVTSFLMIFAFPPITIALAELLFDRAFATNFFRVEGGGQPIFWQHLFWIFGHPEVYILVLPAMGIVSEVIPTFSRKPLFGYPIVVFSGAVIGLMGFSVWSHHMFATGLGKVATAAFSLLTMAIAVPTGVKIFNWVGTLWGGRINFSVPMVFSLGFILMFMLGGFSGIMHAAAPADLEQHDSYFIVAHFHYVLLGGVLLGLLSGIYYWTPKIFGKMMDQKLGYWVAVLVIGGFNIAFFPMHYLGLIGMTRRTYTYLGDRGWNFWNFVSTMGAYMLGIGVFLCFMDLVRTVRSKNRACGPDPWDARTLEWSLSSPVPVYNYAQIPVVSCRDAWWMEKHGDVPIEYEQADLSHGVHMPSQSWMPLFAGMGMLIFGMDMVLMSAGVPYTGYIAIGGLATTVFFIYLWALEGPGGYHLAVPAKQTPPAPTPVGTHQPAAAHH
jgi:cytochrome c oxidase subunit I